MHFWLFCTVQIALFQCTSLYCSLNSHASDTGIRVKIFNIILNRHHQPQMAAVAIPEELGVWRDYKTDPLDHHFHQLERNSSGCKHAMHPWVGRVLGATCVPSTSRLERGQSCFQNCWSGWFPGTLHFTSTGEGKKPVCHIHEMKEFMRDQLDERIPTVLWWTVKRIILLNIT